MKATRWIEANTEGNNLRIGIVMSRFNEEICKGLLDACLDALQKKGVVMQNICIATVPGALEIPITLQAMANSNKYDALIALGAVIRGETYHFEVVANESAHGVSQVQLDTGIPVANAILTTNNEKEANQRVAEKGRDAALVAIEMANLLNQLTEIHQ
jgi:6,7-dimethyl-8-ribityllumazine synthase